MFSKVLILALAAAVANCQIISSYQSGGIPVYRTSGLYGGLYGANGYGYGANLGRVGGLGALRTSGAIIGRGAFGYGTGGYVAGGPAYSSLAVAAPAVKVAAPAVGVASYGAGLGYGLGAGYGAGYGASYGLGQGFGVAARGISVHQAGPVNAAVQTISRTVDYRPVPYSGDAATVQDIDVPPQESPLRINFQSKSSPLQVSQQHIPAEPGQVQVTQSEDEPQQVVHNVLRSVHQQVNEVVQPYRSLTQTVEPVIEQSHTNIAQGEGVHLTGLSSGVLGGTGQIAASGVGVVAPAVGVSTIGVARPAVAGYGVGYGAGYGAGYGLGYNGYRSGLYGQGLGYGVGGLYGSGYRSGYGSGLYGNRGYGGYGGFGGYGSSIYGGYGGLGYGYGNGLGYGRSYGSYGTYGSGLGLNALSGLSTYGTTSKIARVF